MPVIIKSTIKKQRIRNEKMMLNNRTNSTDCIFSHFQAISALPPVPFRTPNPQLDCETVKFSSGSAPGFKASHSALVRLDVLRRALKFS